MRKDLYQELYDLEDNYWWHVGKREIIKSQIGRIGPIGQIKILDVGCGAGRWMEEMGKMLPGSEIWGIDKEPAAINFCRERKLTNLKIASAENLPFPDSSFDLVTCLDLLEHVEDDKKAIFEFHRVLKPKGLLIISAPAYKKLFSYWDKMLQHKRRYEDKEIRDMLEKQKFKIIKLMHSNFFIFLPSLLIRFLKSKKKGAREFSDFMPVPSFLNKFLIFLYRLEAVLLRRMDLPFGLSILAVVQK